jgi:hypothetical protein
MKKLFLSLIFVLCSGLAHGAEYSGKVKGFYINSSKLTLLKLDIATSDCSDNNWSFQFSLDNAAAKEWVSMILMAKASAATLKVGYTPNPAGRCSINYLYFY